MGEHGRSGARLRRKEGREELHVEHLGEDAMRFATWFLGSKFHLMEAFLGELDARPADRHRDELKRRFLDAVDHAQRVVLARGIVTAVLALSAVTAFATTVMDRLQFLPRELAGLLSSGLDAVAAIAAIAGSLTLVLIVARLAIDRYLERIDTTATFLAMQVASAHYV